MSVYRIWTNDPIESPVTAQELADWLRLDDASDPVLPGMLTLATQLVEDYLNLALLVRTFNLVYSHWPMLGSPAGGLSRRGDYPAAAIALPFAAYELVQVESLALYGDASTDFQITSGQPATLEFTTTLAHVLNPPEPAIVCIYSSGYDEDAASNSARNDGVPGAIKQGLLIVAGYLFKNRGACNIQDAIKDSGANVILYPFRQSPVVM
jgi:hypothetical protein